VLPPGHVAVGYLCYSLMCRLRDRSVPDDLAVLLAVALGALVPDLVDKTLTWTIALLPYGRSLAHSGFLTLVVVAVAVLAARRYGRVPIALAVGWASHLAADAVGIVLSGDWPHLWYYLGWPLFPLPPDATVHEGYVEFARSFEVTPMLALEAAAVVLAVVAWNADGRPGIGAVRRRIAEFA
jgi:hypothetical protein